MSKNYNQNKKTQLPIKKHVTKSTKNYHAFSMIELLAVISIIVILSSFLLPAIGSVKKSSLKAKTKAQFQQYALALEQYRLQNGTYPQFITQAGEAALNLSFHQGEFIHALKPFYQFTEQEFTEGKISDSLGNPNIYLIADTNNDGLIHTHSKVIHAPVVFYTLKDDNLNFESIESWR